MLNRKLSFRGPFWLVVCCLTATSPAFAVNLDGVLDLALKNDPRLRAAAYRRDAVAENKTQAVANLLPHLGASATYDRGNSKVTLADTEVSDSDLSNDSYSVWLRQSLYHQENYESLDIARAQISEADALYQVAYLDFLVRVAERYFLVLTLTDGVTFAEAEETAFQRQYEQAEQRFEVGLTAVTDVHEAKASYDSARARAIVSRNNLADAKEALRELTGTYFEDYDSLQPVLPLVEPSPANAEEWVKMALASNPAIRSVQASVEAAEADVRFQRAGHFPTLDLVAKYNDYTNNKYLVRDDFQQPIGTTSLGVDDTTVELLLAVPIYSGGAVSSRTRQASYLFDARSQDLDDIQRTTVRQARNSYRGVLSGIEEVGAYGQAVISAQSAVDATQAGFEVGTRTIVDVLIAQQHFYQAQRDNSLARHAYILSHLRLKLVAGLLTEDDLRVVNQLLQ